VVLFQEEVKILYIFTSSFLNRTQHDSSSTKGSLGNSQRTSSSPKLLQWQAESTTLSF